jgi:POT family proton-dependent oligopeptide transporter
MWLVGATVVITLGELYLSPVGLSFVTKVAPARMVSMMMGMWFLSNFIGNYLSGYLGTYWEKIPHTAFFMIMTAIGVGAGILLFAAGPVLQRLTGGNDKKVVLETGPVSDAVAVSEATTSH